MTNKEKDEKIKRLLRLLDAARARNREQHKDFNAAMAEIADLEANAEVHIQEAQKANNALLAEQVRAKQMSERIDYLEKVNKDFQHDVDMLRQLKRPDEQERLKRQHVVMLQLAAFTEGIMLAELVDNPSENLGYDMGRDRVRSFIMASESIVLEK